MTMLILSENLVRSFLLPRCPKGAACPRGISPELLNRINQAAPLS